MVESVTPTNDGLQDRDQTWEGAAGKFNSALRVRVERTKPGASHSGRTDFGAERQPRARHPGL